MSVTATPSNVGHGTIRMRGYAVAAPPAPAAPAAAPAAGR